MPGGFRQFAPILERLAPRVMTVARRAPGDGGRVNLSLHFGATQDELLRAGRDPERLLIVEVNHRLPRTRSLPPQFDNTIPLDLVDVLVETDTTAVRTGRCARRRMPTRAIAEHALEFVTDGCTLQTGIGAVPNIVATGSPRAAAATTACTRRCSPPG